MITKNYSELKSIIDALNGINNIDPTTNKEIKDKLSYGMSRLIDRVNSVSKKYREQLDDINVEYAQTDKDGILLYDEKGNYKYTKDGFKKRKAAIDELEGKTFDIEPYIVKDCPRINDLSYYVQIGLNGLLFNIELE